MNDNNFNRRSFIVKLLWAGSAILGILTMIPVIGAIFAPLLKKTPKKWRSLGNVDDFEIGKTVLVSYENAVPLKWSGLSSKSASWLRRVSEKEFVALSINCAHLGCPVRWMPDAEIFLCPCHGGVYNKDGSYAAGPPPHGLSQYPTRIRNNQLEIETSPVPITNLISNES